jgi:hypothetical protein
MKKQNYKTYAEQNNHSESEIEKMVDGLFGVQAVMNLIEKTETYNKYDMGNNYRLYTNNSSHDTVDLLDGNGDIIESWSLNY